MGQWLVLTDIFVSTAHHAVHTHFLSEGVGVGVAEAVLAGLVLSVVLVASDGDHRSHWGYRLDHRLGHRRDHIGRGDLVVLVGLSVGLVSVALALATLLVLVEELVVMTVIVLMLLYHGGKI